MGNRQALKVWYLLNMRAEKILSASKGLWTIRKVKPDTCHPTVTYLWRMTEGSLHTEHGELVMADHMPELHSHLNFIQKAEGKILVTGLGLGCVVRGLLAKPQVKRVDVVERDETILELVGEHMPKDSRLHIHKADATKFDFDMEWDFAWHDLWSDPDRAEPHLTVIHSRAMIHFNEQVQHQGAWAMERYVSRLLGALR